ncbi:guanine deaminase [Marinomonas spartinae]|uniref:guanine deaminase n=1 Tax=Marinomonas spartinae TaxID=1792290 RepID=UPI0018F147A8|nr:guanine deaminase [Marinomonas spartinae]MBJ7555590.1 guanine deaminase [Marinomonas spartinae]
MSTTSLQAHCSSVLHFLGQDKYEYFSDGLLLVDTCSGRIVDVGHREALLKQYPQAAVFYYQDALIMPGLIDTHVHYPQVDVIASHGEQLLAWLDQYTFPTEARFSDPEHAQETAEFFLEELLRNGTTTAAVFGSVHASAAEAFFCASEKRNTRMIMGKSMMDRNTPDALSETTEVSYQQTRQLIERWHHNGRQLYAATLRFVVTSTPAQFAHIRTLMEEFPDLYMQTHLAENLAEVTLVKEMFPERRDYVDVFDHHGLLGPRSLFGHGIHLSEAELVRLKDSDSRIAFCPTSNLFLGSGLFDLDRTSKMVQTGIATDVGAGTSFSMLATLSEAYKICQINGTRFSPLRAFYMATLGNAGVLSLESRVGNFESGKEADFVIYNLACTPLMKRRQALCQSIEERLFALMVLGDDRAVQSTFIAGKCQYLKESSVKAPSDK